MSLSFFRTHLNVRYSLLFLSYLFTYSIGLPESEFTDYVSDSEFSEIEKWARSLGANINNNGHLQTFMVGLRAHFSISLNSLSET